MVLLGVEVCVEKVASTEFILKRWASHTRDWKIFEYNQAVFRT